MTNILSADLGNGAAPHAIEHGGVRYEFRHFGLPELAEYERERYRQERDRLRELKDDYPASVYVERLDDLRGRYDRHDFSFEADVERLASPAVLLLVLRIMTRRTEAEVWRLFCAMPEEVGALMRLVIEESFPKATAPARGPNP